MGSGASYHHDETKLSTSSNVDINCDTGKSTRTCINVDLDRLHPSFNKKTSSINLGCRRNVAVLLPTLPEHIPVEYSPNNISHIKEKIQIEVSSSSYEDEEGGNNNDERSKRSNSSKKHANWISLSGKDSLNENKETTSTASTTPLSCSCPTTPSSRSLHEVNINSNNYNNISENNKVENNNRNHQNGHHGVNKKQQEVEQEVEETFSHIENKEEFASRVVEYAGDLFLECTGVTLAEDICLSDVRMILDEVLECYRIKREVLGMIRTNLFGILENNGYQRMRWAEIKILVTSVCCNLGDCPQLATVAL